MLSIIEAKLLVLTFCISWCQLNENWLRNKGFLGAKSLKLWCFLSLKRNTFCETLYNMNCLKCVSGQYAIFKFCLTLPFKEFRGWPLKVNIVYYENQKYFVIHYRTKYLDKDKTYSTIWRFRGQLFKLRAERGQQYFLNISKTKNNLLSIIEAKLLVSTFCISWYQLNENWLRNEGFEGAESMKLWCFSVC